MEHFSYPEPMPSMSTPVQSTAIRTEPRARRHTITRPDSAMALLSDMEEEDNDDNDDDDADAGDDAEQQEAFDRISGILSSLIQEANEAVHGIEQERVHLLKKTKPITQQQKRSKTPRQSLSLATNDSRIPRPRKSRNSLLLQKQDEEQYAQQLHHHLQQQQQQHHHQQHPHHPHPSHHQQKHVRNGSTSSILSSTSSSTATTTSPTSVCFSPTTSTSSSVITNQSYNGSSSKQFLFRHTALRPRSCPVIAPPRRRSHTPRKKIIQDPLMESFKRLDSSMAVVDSLSRDLAKQHQEEEQVIEAKNKKLTMINDSKLTLLLLIPLLHIPHSLITMVFDFCSTPQPLMTKSSNGSFTTMMFWACVFTVANLMVDKMNVKPKRRLSLPGSYFVKSKPKRTWTPSTKTIVEEKLELKRRNSI